MVELKAIYLSLFLCTSTSTAFCQATHRDSLTKAAQADAKRFRLDNATWKKYRHSLPSTSDHYKPTEATPKNKTLLTDSSYVQSYRKAAYHANKHRRTPWHYVLVGGGILAIGYVVLGIYIVSAY